MPFGTHKKIRAGSAQRARRGSNRGYLPIIRCRLSEDGKKMSNFHFRVFVLRPSARVYAGGRMQSENARAVIEDVLGHGNENCMLSGQMEMEAEARSAKNGGLQVSEAETEAFAGIVEGCGMERCR